MLQGPLGFFAFWGAALSAGLVLVALVVGGSLAWVLMAALPAVFLVAMILARRRGKP